MNELELLKQESVKIIKSESSIFIPILTEWINDDENDKRIEFLVRSEETGKYYTFINDGDKNYDFKERN